MGCNLSRSIEVLDQNSHFHLTRYVVNSYDDLQRLSEFANIKRVFELIIPLEMFYDKRFDPLISKLAQKVTEIFLVINAGPALRAKFHKSYQKYLITHSLANIEKIKVQYIYKTANEINSYSNEY